MTEPSSVLRLFGAELKHARERAGLTQEELGAKVAYSRGQIGMVETGQRFMKAETVRQSDDILHTDGLLYRIWLAASRDRSAIRVADLVEAERRATAIRSYHPVYVPGLLQVEPYARALLEAGRFSGVSHDEIDERVSTRLYRQEILTLGLLKAYWVILDEAVLHRNIGGAKIMRQQLTHLLGCTRHKFINIQLMPFASFAFPASGPMTILDIDGEGPVVHLDGPVAVQTTSDPGILDECVQQFDVLRSQASSLPESVRMIESRLEEIR